MDKRLGGKHKAQLRQHPDLVVNVEDLVDTASLCTNTSEIAHHSKKIVREQILRQHFILTNDIAEARTERGISRRLNAALHQGKTPQRTSRLQTKKGTQ
eukprot:2781928-Rhodomonas_salina.2